MNELPHVFRGHPVNNVDIVKADGVHLYDTSGRRFVDFESGIWCASLGHNHPRVNACIRDHLEKVVHLGPRHVPRLAEEAACELLRHTPFKDGKAVFLSSGSEAVELGIRLALEYTQRMGLLTFTRSYLGAYGAAANASVEKQRTEVDIDVCVGCRADECSLSCPRLSHLEFSKLAAFVLEPILVSGGVIVPPKKAVTFLVNETRNSGGLIVVDEVTTGLGRTGTWLGLEHFGFSPDIIAFGKTLGNGYPVSAVAMTRPIGEQFEQRGFYYVQSHQNDPLGCAVANQVITVLEEQGLVNRSRKTGEFLRDCLQRVGGDCPAVSEVRGMGLTAAMQLSPDAFNKADSVEAVGREMCERGYIIGLKPGHRLLRFLPPFTITENDIAGMCSSLSDVLSGTGRART